MTYLQYANNVAYSVDCSCGSCTYRHCRKMGYCKHLLHAHALLNEDNGYICVGQQFNYKGNRKITLRDRGEELGMHYQHCRKIEL